MPSPVAGTLAEQIAKEGDTVAVGALIALIGEGAAVAGCTAPALRRKPRAVADRKQSPAELHPHPQHDASLTLSPAVRRAVLANHVDPSSIKGSGKDGRITKDDVLAAATAKTQRSGAGRGPAPKRKPRQPPQPTLRLRRSPAFAGDRTRRTRQDDPHAADHRHPAQGCAEHRRLAHHLQRCRHDRGDRRPRPLQGSVREEARHPPRLHGLLREGGRARRQGRALGQRQHRRRRDRLSRLSRRLGRGVGAQGAGRPGRPRRRPHELRRDRKGHRGVTARRPRTARSPPTT